MTPPAKHRELIMRKARKSTTATPGCIKVRFSGRGQPGLRAVDLELQGQAVPAPCRRVFEMELDATLRLPFLYHLGFASGPAGCIIAAARAECG